MSNERAERRIFSIGIDGRELEGKPTGVGSYLGNILRHMRVPSNFDVHLFFKNEIPDCNDIQAKRVLLGSKQRNVFWENGTLAGELKRRKIDLFFTPTANSIFSFQGAQVAAVHDLSYYNYPEWFRPRERWVRKLNARRAIRKAQRIYVISNHVRKEIIDRFQIAPEKILLTPVGVEQPTHSHTDRTILRKSYGYEGFKMILYVGSIFQRRHVPVILAALRELEENVRLIVIGENRTFPRIDLHALAEKEGVAQRVVFLEYAAAKVVEDYYRMSDVFVYLSTYEGFGIPPLEAMAYGVPVVISKTPAMDEVYTGCAEFAEIQPAAVAASIRRVLSDSALRDRLIQSGLQKVKLSRWEDTASLIVHDWERLLATRS